MATSQVEDSNPLLESLASDGSFDIIDTQFDPAFSELTGVASADYIPLETDEVLVKKGESGSNAVYHGRPTKESWYVLYDTHCAVCVRFRGVRHSIKS